VREVWKELGQGTGYTTVLKFLQIMLDKKLVKRNESRMTHIYEAAVTETSTQDKLLHGLIHRAFSGSPGQLVLRALSEKSVLPEELNMIRSLIAARRDGEP
jgi:predicted transcriptional regulator